MSSVCVAKSPKIRKISCNSLRTFNSSQTILEYHPVSSQWEVQDKNRYSNVFPSVNGMITLKNNGKTIRDIYINADKVPAKEMFGTETDYIMTQAPLIGTWKDFWLMIYEQQSALIVMLCGMNKCTQYWPKFDSDDDRDKREFFYENFILKIVPKKEYQKEKILSIVRKFTIEKYDYDNKLLEEFNVFQIQFKGWPDFGLPECCISNILNLMDQFRNDSTPTIHCSAGIGRAGTFVACDIVRRLKNKVDSIDSKESTDSKESIDSKEEPKIVIDPKLIIKMIRNYRIGSVQTKEQEEYVSTMLK